MRGAGPLAFALTALIALSAGCAKREPPSGGPPDLQPPRLMESTPDSGTARVAIDQPISIVFTEPMEPRSTEDAVTLKPPVTIAKHRWDGGRTLRLILAEPLLRNQTYVMAVDGSARDRHGNMMGVGVTRVFSTADSFPPGRIDGDVEGRGLAAEGMILWCYVEGRLPDSTARDYDAIGQVDAQRAFRIDGLAAPARYTLWAFADLNRNRSFEPDADVLVKIDTTIALTRAEPVARDVHLVVVNPRAPGTVQGTVVDSLADSVSVRRVLAVSESDTTRRLLTNVEEGGTFEIDLDAGSWTLRAFRDVDKSQSWQSDREPASAPYRVTITPAVIIVDVRLRIDSGGP